ncbi:MAG: family 1 glycosylhydrolase [Lachnospiraceae bacterium]|nr:family 1 glycosylhydrolase [Lachnospiraceae bacterium]
MGFSKDFLWGAATAAYQVEGAYADDGKGLGIWDALSEGHVVHGDNGNISTDHYHRYKEDVALMKEIGLKTYRFSISWPRVIPEEGVVNEKGLAFYSSLVDELLAAGIEPMVTLFHWNLPMWAYEKGGWLWDGISDVFADYVKIVVDALSDRVQYWMTINEPQAFIGGGYLGAMHAPFLQVMDKIPELTKNTLYAHGKAVSMIRANAGKKPLIGFAPTGSYFTPEEDTPEAVEKARQLTYEESMPFGTAWWMDPVLLGTIPQGQQNILTAEDMKIIYQPLDFCGFNLYNSNNYNDPYDGSRNPLIRPGIPRTAMGWPITPEALYWIPRFHYERYHLPILITENGMANIDFIMSDGQVHDPQRIDYMRRYLKEVRRAVDDGIPVMGYQYWSFMDNFEWADGYDKRFGLIYVDYQTLERTPKDSARFYAEVIRTNGENL